MQQDTTQVQAQTEQPLSIMRLEVTNFGVIKFVALTPEGKVMRLTGEAGSGKTTVVMALRTLTGGKSYAPAMPIRMGAQKAEILLILGADGRPLYRIRQTFTGRSESFAVTDADGKPVPSPRAFMAGLVGSKLALDPASFLRLSPQEQAQEVLKAAGVDLASLDADAKKAFDERTATNRDVSRLEAQLKGLLEPEGLSADAKEESLQEVLAEQQKLLAEKQKNEERRATARRVREDAEAAQRRHDEAQARVASQEAEAKRLEAALEKARRQLAEGQASLVALLEQAVAAASGAEEVEASVADLKDPDLTGVTVKLAGLEDHNKKVGKRKERLAKAAELAEAQAESERLTAIIDKVAATKKRLLGSIDLGVPELRVDDGRLMYGMVPFEQASMSQKLLGALAVGLNTNTRLPLILLEEAAFLSPEKLRELAEFAEKRGAMIWIERPLVDGPNPGVMLVDGTVEGAEDPDTAVDTSGQGDLGV
jgi:DNA repair ATPase RecN